MTGQPNAMGGREVGGLANVLAAHMQFTPEDIARVGRFWNAPAMAVREGPKAVAMFDAIARGEIKALWVMATNPAVSLPHASRVREAVAKLELFVVSENVLASDTVNAGAQLLLPACAWGEKDGTVTNSERRISRQRAFLSAPGETRPDWWIISQVARRLGFAAAFSYHSAAQIFREHAALSAFENEGRRAFDLGGLADISDGEFDALDPVQWPLCSGGDRHARKERRFFAAGQFYTPNRKACFIAPELLTARATNEDMHNTAISRKFPLRLNTGRVRDQWHSMTRSGISPRLGAHAPEPFVEVHPLDAAAANLTDEGHARVASRYGSCVLKVAVSDRQHRGSLFAPIHWSAATAAAARIGDLVMPDTDPHSGQPDSKATPASIAPVHYRWRGFMLTRRPIDLPPGSWWARVAVAKASGLLLATNDPPDFWRGIARQLLGDDLAEYADELHGIYRAAALMDSRIEACLFVGPADAAPQWDAVKTLFETEALTDEERRVLLSGRSADGLHKVGPIVCACFSVGLATICDAIRSGRATTVEHIGKALHAGTNCGSCLPELKQIVARA